MNPYMIVATFKEGTDMREVYAVVREEQEQVARLRAQNRMGAVHVSRARATVFIEVFAESDAEAEATVKTLPMSRWLNIELYPTFDPIANGPKPE